MMSCRGWPNARTGIKLQTHLLCMKYKAEDVLVNCYYLDFYYFSVSMIRNTMTDDFDSTSIVILDFIVVHAKLRAVHEFKFPVC